MASSGAYLIQGIQKSLPFSILVKRFAGYNIVNQRRPTSTKPEASIIPDAPGLSSAVHTNEEPVGPGASRTGEYKVPEYYNFNKTSYFQAEIEMAKYRGPQPSAIENK